MGLYANTSYGELYMFKKMVSNNKDHSSTFFLDVDSRQYNYSTPLIVAMTNCFYVTGSS